MKPGQSVADRWRERDGEMFSKGQASERLRVLAIIDRAQEGPRPSVALAVVRLMIERGAETGGKA